MTGTGSSSSGASGVDAQLSEFKRLDAREDGSAVLTLLGKSAERFYFRLPADQLAPLAAVIGLHLGRQPAPAFPLGAEQIARLTGTGSSTWSEDRPHAVSPLGVSVRDSSGVRIGRSVVTRIAAYAVEGRDGDRLLVVSENGIVRDKVLLPEALARHLGTLLSGAGPIEFVSARFAAIENGSEPDRDGVPTAGGTAPGADPRDEPSLPAGAPARPAEAPEIAR